MLESAQVKAFLNLDKTKDKEYQIFEKVFGRPGNKEPAPVYFSSLNIDDYKKTGNG